MKANLSKILLKLNSKEIRFVCVSVISALIIGMIFAILSLVGYTSVEIDTFIISASELLITSAPTA